MSRSSRVRASSKLCVALAAAFLACSCAGGTETGNPSFTTALSYTGYSSLPSQFGLLQGGSIATIDSAWFDLAEISFSSDESCGAGGNERIQTPALGVGDHAAGNHNSTAYQGRAGTFCSVEVPFSSVASASNTAPSELIGHALLVRGTLADGTPFSIVSDATPMVELRAMQGGFELEPSSGDLLLAFDFATWLKNVDFSAAERRDGVVVISREMNPAELVAFDAALPVGIALYRDRDRDGRIDPDAEQLAHGP